ncbi:MFS transporter [Paenibacillus sp. BIHB 4019]|uniref:MFS transporter n=1 Tax=Paenibacillus sp. BIHB 4019 TaxID=1870819 RepID=A0A1B2DKS7_9BACL|nr:MFS transporter [Paenibacillus sp. BIHB 4019]ANY68320.1 MFS transporter [Paenibacillus sp. BIHB 4019]
MNKHQLTSSRRAAASTPATDRLPWAALLALAMAGFICILTETIPAGLLPQIARGLQISESLAGQLVTAYALGTLLTAIPLTAATNNWRRRPLLLLCMFGFLLFNSVTAFSSSFGLTLIARFMAGVSSGILWGMSAGYARRMVPDALKGRAMAVAMLGSPIALALGVPAGTFLGVFAGWRFVFGIMSLLAMLLILWMMWKMPDFAGQPSAKRRSLYNVMTIPGVRPVLAVVLAWMLAHNILYTYIAPYLAMVGLVERVDVVLLVFGVASVAGIILIGLLIDRMLRAMVLISLAGFAVASILLGIGSSEPMIVYIAIALWGVTFGGAATLLQTAAAEAAGDHADVAQSMLVTAWNLAIGGGGLIGALLLETLGVISFPWTLSLLVIIALLIAFVAKEHGFRSNRG